jgi:hypothetical protein
LKADNGKETVPLPNPKINIERAMIAMQGEERIAKFMGSWRGETVICVGNGTSRQGIDLKELQAPGVHIVGCNALFREVDADILAVIDGKMVTQMISHQAYEKSRFFTTSRKRPELQDEKHLFIECNVDKMLGRFSGGLAIAISVLADPEQIFLLGFDFTSGDRIYEGTIGYRNRPARAVTSKNWLRMFTQMVNYHREKIRFFEVENNKLPCKTISKEVFLLEVSRASRRTVADSA